MTCFLGGCNPFFGYTPTSDQLLTKHWAKSKQQHMPKIYCYKTLGENQCFNKPIKGKDHLLLGEHIEGFEPYKKSFVEHLNIHPFFGIDDDTLIEKKGISQQHTPIHRDY